MNGFAILRTALSGVLVSAMAGCAMPHAQSAAKSQAPSDDRPTLALSAAAARAYRDGQWDQAAEQYERLSQRIPAHPRVWLRLGNVYAQQGMLDRAVTAYHRSLSLDSDDARPWFNLATAHLLNAQQALTRAWHALPDGDPEREMIEQRLHALTTSLASLPVSEPVGGVRRGRP